MISSLDKRHYCEAVVMFQSRNRGSFGFKVCRRSIPGTPARGRFQSRNRGSFDFKQLQTK